MAKVKSPAEGKRTARVNLALPAKLAETLRTLAFIDRISTNELIKNICSNYAKTRVDDLNEFEKFLERINKEAEQFVKDISNLDTSELK